MYHLATVRFATDGRTDNSIMPVADHTVWQYDWLKTLRFIRSLYHLHSVIIMQFNLINLLIIIFIFYLIVIGPSTYVSIF